MVFTSHIFIFYFLPAVLLVYYLLPARRNLSVLVASYAFYGWQDPRFVLLLGAATAINYLGGHLIARWRGRPHRARAALALSIIASLGLLGFFKYAVFAQANVSDLLTLFGGGPLPIWHIALPAGLSFYTFASLSYSIDVYRGTSAPVRSFWDFACYVSLFPQLIAGPIVRYNTIAGQLIERTHTLDRFAAGVALFVLGFAKKVLLAGPLGTVADAAFAAESPHALDAWFGAVAYAFQIYFDFAGYSDMAIGLGRTIGFEIPRNFDAPYRAESITDFWRRWHISLSTFLRDYLYIPLGGNRKGRRRTYVNLAVVMLLGGLWHGASWTFVIWGGVHGALLAFERSLGKQSLYARAPAPIRVGITFVLVLISWVFFRAHNLGHAVGYLGAMFGLGGSSPASDLLAAMLYTRGHLIVVALCAVLAFGRVQAFDWIQRLTWIRVIVLIVLFYLAVATMFTQAFSPFLYFRF